MHPRFLPKSARLLRHTTSPLQPLRCSSPRLTSLHRQATRSISILNPPSKSTSFNNTDTKPTSKSRSASTATEISSSSPQETYPLATTTQTQHADLEVHWAPEQSSKFSWFYLRDHCPCPQCRHPDTKQRLQHTFSIPPHISSRSITETPSGLRILWSEDQHESVFPWAWLRAHLQTQDAALDVSGQVQTVATWGAEIAREPPSIEYEFVMREEEGVREWTALIQRFGFAYVDGCPATPEATNALVERIAFVRTTHYGGFWDFTANLASKDTAYTSLALGAHTDTTYFSDPAGLQLFHLLSHTHGSGGESLLVDGYHVFNTLQNESQAQGVDISPLTSTTLLGHASGNVETNLRAEYAVCQGHVPEHGEPLDPYERKAVVRWNNDDRAAMRVPVEDVHRWYQAAKKWDDVLRRESSEYWAQLKPGRPLIFNNQRVLHGRAAFSGKRRMCGAYVNMDDFLSRWRTLNFRREDLLDRT